MSSFHLGAEEVDAIDETLAALAQERRGPTRLIVDNHWPEITPGPAILSAALMGSLSDRQLTVDVTDDDAAFGLCRYGVASALSLREGGTTFGPSAAKLENPELGWMWTPGLRGAVQGMFAEASAAPPDGAFGPDFATFVDAHLVSGASGSNDVTYLIRRWLGRRLTDLHERPLSALDRIWIDHVSFAIDELVDNVREHAGAAENPRPRSLLCMSFTRSERPAVVCAVVDNGVGIDRTLRDKVDGATRALAPSDRLQRLLGGQILPWGVGRGRGLARIVQLVDKCDARMMIATDRVRADIRSGGDVEASAGGFAVHGTVVSLTVFLPSA